MKFISTRNGNYKITGTEAVIKGISPDGGLFVPESFPKVNLPFIDELCDLTYPQTASKIMALFMDDFSEEELFTMAEDAYKCFSDPEDACPVVNVDDAIFITELWHGPTFAFKDVALSFLPRLLTACKKKMGNNEKTLILVATSGDTGKAAIEGFKDVEGTDIIVFYPEDGVSEAQKLQMKTSGGQNVYVAGIKGNFDDAQNGVKRIFADDSVKEELKEKGFALSSANSINWGRLMPQIVYYFTSYCQMVNSGEIELGDEINFCVPCGNFGNILAGWYAKQMGLPIKNLICASNSNKVLTDFFNTGKYSIKDREFIKTTSPSMDILISSNLERLVFEILGRDWEKTALLMKNLKEKGEFEIDKKALSKKAGCFFADYATLDEVENAISVVYESSDYLLDPHTAVAMVVSESYYNQVEDDTLTIVMSTANPYKFPQAVHQALFGREEKDAFKAMERVAQETGEPIPYALLKLKETPIRFNDVLYPLELRDKVIEYTKKTR